MWQSASRDGSVAEPQEVVSQPCLLWHPVRCLGSQALSVKTRLPVKQLQGILRKQATVHSRGGSAPKYIARPKTIYERGKCSGKCQTGQK